MLGQRVGLPCCSKGINLHRQACPVMETIVLSLYVVTACSKRRGQLLLPGYREGLGSFSGIHQIAAVALGVIRVGGHVRGTDLAITGTWTTAKAELGNDSTDGARRLRTVIAIEVPT